MTWSAAAIVFIAFVVTVLFGGFDAAMHVALLGAVVVPILGLIEVHLAMKREERRRAEMLRHCANEPGLPPRRRG